MYTYDMWPFIIYVYTCRGRRCIYTYVHLWNICIYVYTNDIASLDSEVMLGGCFHRLYSAVWVLIYIISSCVGVHAFHLLLCGRSHTWITAVRVLTHMYTAPLHLTQNTNDLQLLFTSLSVPTQQQHEKVVQHVKFLKRWLSTKCAVSSNNRADFLRNSIRCYGKNRRKSWSRRRSQQATFSWHWCSRRTW